MKTDIINKTNQSFELKEGNAGAYRFLKQLDPGTKYSIKVDPNATYREYMVATGKKGESIFLTSDDFSEYKVIDIEEGPGENPGTLIYKSMNRNPRDKKSGPKVVVSDPPASSAAEVVSDPPASSAAGVVSDPPGSSAAAVGSVPPVSSPAGVELVPPASSTASSKPSKNVPWYRKPKSWFK